MTDQQFWATEIGAVHLAPAGHVEFARRTLGLPPSVAADIAAYAMWNLGWVELTLRADHTALVRYAADAIEEGAATAARAWLLDRTAQIRSVLRQVDLGDKWGSAAHTTTVSAAFALEGAVMRPCPPFPFEWKVERLPLDSVNPRLAPLLKAWHEDPGTIIPAATGLGLFATSSMLRSECDEVTSLYIGPDLGLDSRYVGRNVLDRPDIRYADLIRNHVCEAVREGPTFYRLQITIDDIVGKYERIALPAGASTDPGLVLTSSQVLWRYPPYPPLAVFS